MDRPFSNKVTIFDSNIDQSLRKSDSVCLSRKSGCGSMYSDFCLHLLLRQEGGSHLEVGVGYKHYGKGTFFYMMVLHDVFSFRNVV